LVPGTRVGSELLAALRGCTFALPGNNESREGLVSDTVGSLRSLPRTVALEPEAGTVIADGLRSKFAPPPDPGVEPDPEPRRVATRGLCAGTPPTPRPITLVLRVEELVRLPLRTVPLPPPETGADAVELMLRAGLRSAPLFGEFESTGDNVRLGATPTPVLGNDRDRRSGLDPFLCLLFWLGASDISSRVTFRRAFPIALIPDEEALVPEVREQGFLISKLAMWASNPLNSFSHSFAAAVFESDTSFWCGELDGEGRGELLPRILCHCSTSPTLILRRLLPSRERLRLRGADDEARGCCTCSWDAPWVETEGDGTGERWGVSWEPDCRVRVSAGLGGFEMSTMELVPSVAST
jgi:hypothetical protein